MTYTLEKDGPTEFVGAVKLRTFTMDVTNYDDDAAGDGEAFGPSDARMNRFLTVSVDVIDGTGMSAQYDETVGAVRLFESADLNGNHAEVTSNNNEGAKLRVTVWGK